MAESFAPTIKVLGDPTFYKNGLRFATAEEAEASAKDTYSRWMVAEEHSFEKTPDPVNAKWENGQVVMLPVVAAE